MEERSFTEREDRNLWERNKNPSVSQEGVLWVQKQGFYLFGVLFCLLFIYFFLNKKEVRMGSQKPRVQVYAPE